MNLFRVNQSAKITPDPSTVEARDVAERRAVKGKCLRACWCQTVNFFLLANRFWLIARFRVEMFVLVEKCRICAIRRDWRQFYVVVLPWRIFKGHLCSFKGKCAKNCPRILCGDFRKVRGSCENLEQSLESGNPCRSSRVDEKKSLFVNEKYCRHKCFFNELVSPHQDYYRIAHSLQFRCFVAQIASSCFC